MDAREVLRQTAPFDRLAAELLDAVAASAEQRQFAAQAALLRQGESGPAGLYVVCSGSVQLSVGAAAGAEDRAVLVCRPGDLIGLTTVMTGEPSPVTARALEPVTCLVVSADALARCFTSAAFAAQFSRLLVTRLRRLYDEVSGEGGRAGLDDLPLRRRVEALMTVPAATCGPAEPVAALARQMAEATVSSVVVVDGAEPLGIVTERDLVARVLARQAGPDLTAAEVMSQPLITADPGDRVHQALLQMVRHRIKHLPVVADKQLLGLVTLGDLSRARGQGALAIVDRIERAPDLAALGRARSRADAVLQALVSEGASPYEMLPVVTEFNDRLTCRVIELAEAELAKAGHGQPPRRYVWLNMGSAGRREQFLRTDQDNAIIYDDGPGDARAAEAYFAALSARVVDGLEYCGFARCKGDAMASNPHWRRSVSRWREALVQWFAGYEANKIIMASIFLDFRPVYGDFGLAETVREAVFDSVEKHQFILRNLAEADLEHRVPVGPFGILLTPPIGPRRGQIDLKQDACVHLVDCVRLFALRARVAETNTVGRLQALTRLGKMDSDEAEWLAAAYETLLDLRFRVTLQALAEGEAAEPIVSMGRLSSRDRIALKDALGTVARLQHRVGWEFGVGGVF